MNANVGFSNCLSRRVFQSGQPHVRGTGERPGHTGGERERAAGVRHLGLDRGRRVAQHIAGRRFESQVGFLLCSAVGVAAKSELVSNEVPELVKVDTLGTPVQVQVLTTSK